MSDDEYRLILKEEFDAQSSKDLSDEQASRLIDIFIAKGFIVKAKPKRKLPPGVVGIVSMGQMNYIERLRNEIKWYVPDGFERLLKKKFKIEKIKTSKEAWRVIECLKSLAKKNMDSRPGMTTEEPPF